MREMCQHGNHSPVSIFGPGGGEDREAFMKLTPHSFHISCKVSLMVLDQGCVVREMSGIWGTGEEAVGT